MRRFRGTWQARVDQNFDIEAEDEEAARNILDGEMNPHNVVELLDIEVTRIDVVD